MGKPFAKSKKQHFSNFDPKYATNYKKFWKTVKSLFSDKITVKEVINLTQNGKILSSDTDLAETLNDYFSNIVQNLNIPRENSQLNMDLCINPALAVVKNYNITIALILSMKNLEKIASLNLAFILSLQGKLSGNYQEKLSGETIRRYFY